MKVFILCAALLLAVVASTACTDGGGDSGDAVADLDAWCEIVAEVDEKFSATDNSSDDFRTKQAGYAKIRTLLNRLSSNMHLVDDGAREDVQAGIAFAANVTGTYVDSTDEAAASDALEALFAEADEGARPGAGWILENCGVAVDG